MGATHLSSRAAGVLARLLYPTLDLKHVRSAQTLVLRDMIFKHFGVEPQHVYRKLLLARNCGNVTAREICTQLGLPIPEATHVCICRDCGRTL